MEGPRQRELSHLVPDHVLRHEDRDELLALVHRERQTDHLGDDRRAPRPRLDDLLRLGPLRLERLAHQVLVDERTLLDRTSHSLLTLRPAATNDELVGRFVLASLVTLGRHSPGRARMTTT